MTNRDRQSTVDDRTPERIAPDPEHAFVSTIAGSQPEAAPSEHSGAPSIGARLGRYVLVRLLGEGGMGRVFAAYDRDLDRKVAIKVLARPPLSVEAAARERARMLDEAKALARLAHPNVVAVHDVGMYGEHVYLTMEYVAGESLRGWVAKPRPWATVLGVSIALAEGLAAVHAAGVLHTDVKPDNAIIGGDGRVRLVDFGLARASAIAMTGVTNERIDRVSTPTSDPLGIVAGTPGYMAPEQLGGGAVAASDQFALCVTIWELLYGRRPWQARTREQLAFAMGSRKPEVPEGAPTVPSWLRTKLERGLAPEIGDRFESVHALAAALRGGRARQRRRNLAIAGGCIAACVVAGLGYRRIAELTAERACEQAGDTARAAWTASSRDTVETALLGTRLPYAASTSERGLVALDGYAEALRSAQREACLETTTREAWDLETAALAQGCLERASSTLAQLVARASDDPNHAVRGFARAAATLVPPLRCLDPARLAQNPAPPPALAERVRRVEDELARVSMLAGSGELAEARALATTMVTEADAIGWAPLSSAASMSLASVNSEFGALAETEAAAEDAYFIALRNDPTSDRVAEAAVLLVLTVGPRMQRWTDARRWLRNLEAATRGDNPAAEARLATARGHVANGEGDSGEASDHYKLALDRSIEAVGPDHPDVARATNNLGNALRALNQLEEAVALHRRALGILEACLGPDHPEIADALQNLSNSLFAAEQYMEARDLARRGLALREAALGKESPLVLAALVNLSVIETKLGDPKLALPTHLRIVELAEQTYGVDHFEVADALENLSTTYLALGDHAAALTSLQRALAIRAKAVGGDDASLWRGRFNLGATFQLAGDHRAAIVEFRTALRLIERAHGRDAADVIYPLAGIAESALAIGDHELALATASRAVALDQVEGAASDPRAFAAFGLARALWLTSTEGSPERVRALEHAAHARSLFERVGAHPQGRAEVDAWLASVGHARSP